jgi:hypothetical protein
MSIFLIAIFILAFVVIAVGTYPYPWIDLD